MKKKFAVRRLEEVPTFADVARLTMPSDTPLWLPAQLESWSAGVRHDRMVDEVRPTKAETKAALDQFVEDAVSIGRKLESPFIRPHLEDARRSEKLPSLTRPLRDLAERARLASRSTLLVDAQGKGKPGRGKPKLPNYADARTRLAARAIELWIFFFNEEPRVGNRKLAEIAQTYWLASGGPSGGHGDPINGWKKYFRLVRDRTECVELRQLRRHWKVELAQTARRGSPPWYIGTYFPVSKSEFRNLV
jgi:hypothetical protein